MKNEQVEITEVEYPECVRIRHGMYISSTEQMITEIVDNSVDEFIAGYCTNIAVAIIGDEIIIEDDGRGLSVLPSKKDPSISQAEIAYTKLHAGGKFGSERGGYKVKTGGLHGVGASCVNALSEYCILTIKKDSKKYSIQFKKGITKQQLTEIQSNLDESDTGTEVKFKLDSSIWQDEKPSIKKIKKRLEQLTYLNPGLTVYFYVDRGEEKLEEVYQHKDGLKEYMEKLISKNTPVTKTFTIVDTINDVDIAIGLCYVDTYTEEIYSFCNNINTLDGGDHIIGFKNGISSALNKYIKDNNIKFEFKTNDITEGLVSVVSIKVKDPNFEGQSKAQLKMNKVKNAVKELIESSFYDYLDKNPNEFKNIINKINIAIKAREASANARVSNKIKKDLSDTSNLIAKLADCSSKTPEECELYLVEGESAGGTAKQARDKKYQAILPIFGKILNVEKKRFNQVIKSEKIKLLIKAIKTNIGENFDIDKLRYHKIIVLSDADVDGDHIKILYMTLFYRHLRPIVEDGHLYLACPPLYKIWKGKNIKYAFTDKEKNDIYENDFNKDALIQRFKGLGEMDQDQLWETTMDPKTRTLIKVGVEDLELAEEMLAIAMGENVIPRKQYIMENANFTEDID